MIRSPLVCLSAYLDVDNNHFQIPSYFRRTRKLLLQPEQHADFARAFARRHSLARFSSVSYPVRVIKARPDILTTAAVTSQMAVVDTFSPDGSRSSIRSSDSSRAACAAAAAARSRDQPRHIFSPHGLFVRRYFSLPGEYLPPFLKRELLVIYYTMSQKGPSMFRYPARQLHARRWCRIRVSLPVMSQAWRMPVGGLRSFSASTLPIRRFFPLLRRTYSAACRWYVVTSAALTLALRAKPHPGSFSAADVGDDRTVLVPVRAKPSSSQAWNSPCAATITHLGANTCSSRLLTFNTTTIFSSLITHNRTHLQAFPQRIQRTHGFSISSADRSCRFQTFCCQHGHICMSPSSGTVLQIQHPEVAIGIFQPGLPIHLSKESVIIRCHTIRSLVRKVPVSLGSRLTVGRLLAVQHLCLLAAGANAAATALPASFQHTP